MTRSCSDNTTSHHHHHNHTHCLNAHNTHNNHTPSSRVHSLDTPKSMRETWSDNRLSVPLYPEEDYNVPYNAARSTQQGLDLAYRGKSVCRGRAPPRRYCWPQDVTSEEGYNGDSSGSSGGSPVRDGGIEASTHTSCQEVQRLREESEETKEDFSRTHAAATLSGESPGDVCPQPKRAALRRQNRISQHSQEPLQDPWVRLSDSSPEELPETQQHRHRRHNPDRPISIHAEPIAMSDEENTSKLDNSTADTTGDATSDPPTSETTTPGAKPGPPVAPKPAWFRKSLRKIREEQDQKKQAKPPAHFTRNFGAKSNLSIKQKIHSFETFSSPEGPEKEAPTRAPTSSAPPLEKESRTQPASNGDFRKTPEEIQVDPPAIASSTSESRSLPIDEPPIVESNIGPDPDSGAPQEPHPDLVQEETNVSASKEEPEVESPGPTGPTESTVLPPLGSAEGESPGDVTEDEASQLIMTPPTDSNHVRGLDTESLGRILAFSNQVSQVVMRCHGNPRLPNPQDRYEEDSGPPESEAPEVTDSGFSVSLASLRDCTIERGEGGSHGEAAISSAAAHSVISAVSPQEIQRMIQEVRDMDEETLKQLVDIHVVILHKEEGAGLGFSIAGGSDLESKALTVHKVFPSGLAAKEGTIQKGDEVLSINGQTLHGVTHADATATLRQARSLKEAVVVVCKREQDDGKEGGACRSEDANPAGDEQGVPLSVDLEKGAAGVGFTLEGGKGSIHGDKPLVINRISAGGAAEQSGLQHGDELLQVQGVSLQDMTRFEAWNMIKALPEGTVALVIIRRQRG